jgi:hypothetical protein
MDRCAKRLFLANFDQGRIESGRELGRVEIEYYVFLTK